MRTKIEDRYNKLCELSDLFELYEKLKNNIIYDKFVVYINKQKKTVVLVNDNKKVFAKVTENDKFDARTGVGIVILKHFISLTNSKYENKKYDELTGLTYEELARDLMDYIDLGEDIFEEYIDKGQEIYKINLEFGEPDSECYQEYYDNCEIEEENDYLEEKYNEIKSNVDLIAKALGIDESEYEVQLGNLNGLPGISVTGSNQELENALKRLITPILY